MRHRIARIRNAFWHFLQWRVVGRLDLWLEGRGDIAAMDLRDLEIQQCREELERAGFTPDEADDVMPSLLGLSLGVAEARLSLDIADFVKNAREEDEA